MLMMGLLSPAATGLVAAALLAAFVPSADTSLMTFSRLCVLLIGISALALAISLPNIIKTLMIVYTVFANGMLYL